MSEHLYRWEYTDTFAGEANYCWVKRGIVRAVERDGETWQQRRERVARAARREAGLTGVRCDRSDYGDLIDYRPRGMCTVLFVELGEFFASDSDTLPIDA